MLEDTFSEDFVMAWLKTLIVLLPLFIIGFGFGGFYHEDPYQSGWTLMGTIEFGKMIVNSVAGNIVFWAIVIFIAKLIYAFWHILN